MLCGSGSSIRQKIYISYMVICFLLIASHSTVTDLAKLRGWSISQPFANAE